MLQNVKCVSARECTHPINQSIWWWPRPTVAKRWMAREEDGYLRRARHYCRIDHTLHNKVTRDGSPVRDQSLGPNYSIVNWPTSYFFFRRSLTFTDVKHGLVCLRQCVLQCIAAFSIPEAGQFLHLIRIGRS